MKYTKPTKSLAMLAAGPAAISLIAACGALSKKASSTQSAATNTDPSEMTSFQAPGTLTIGSASVDVPTNAFTEGTRLKAATADDPAEFAIVADTGGSSASPSMSLTATGTDGSNLGQSATPLTIALYVPDEAALTALATNVPKVYDNLCAMSKGGDGTLRVWRRSAMTADTKLNGRFKFKSKWLGIFKFYYCGAMPLSGVSEAKSDGNDATAYTAGQPIASCKITQADGYSQCQTFSGLSFGDNQLLNAYKDKCAEANGTFGVEACPDSSAIGSCVNSQGTVKERATVYSAPSPAPEETALTAAKNSFKNACLAASDNTWAEPGTLVPTPFATQN